MVIKDILDSMEALNKLNNAHGMSSVVAFRIGKNIKAIEGEVKVFDDVRTKLLEEFANKDENGKPIIDKDTNQYDVPSDKLEALEKEIKKVFPDWIREVAINLQNDTVQSSIENTYKSLPFVLKRPVRKLLVDFEKYPVGIEPYDNFLKELDLQDIKSSIKMFYSMNELGKDQSENQLESIIDRNNKMAGRAEEMKNKDKIGAAGMLTALPMLVGVIKIIVDMILMIIVFTSSISNVVNGG